MKIHTELDLQECLYSIFTSILAGLTIGLAGFAFLVCRAYLGECGQLVGSLVFPFGLFAICKYQLSLYTGKIGMAVFDDEIITKLPLMLLFNLIGAFFIGHIMHEGMLPAALSQMAIDISTAKIEIHPTIFFGNSLVCGVLVFLAVYCYTKIKQPILQAVCLWFFIAIFVLTGMDHCIADMFYFAAGTLRGMSILYLVIAILGNSLGAILTAKVMKYCIK